LTADADRAHHAPSHPPQRWLEIVWRAVPLGRPFLAAVLSASLAGAAAAVPTTFTVTAPQPSKQADVFGGGSSASFDVTGTIDATLVASDGTVTGFDLEGASLLLSDVTIPFIGGTVFALRSVRARLTGPPALFLGGSAGSSSFDIAGSQLVFISGVGSVCCAPPNAVNFSTSPLAFDYGPGSIAEIVLTDLLDGTFDVSLLLPLDLATVYPPDRGTGILFVMQGDLAASGTFIPEPSTALLVGIGLAGIGAAVRSRARC
jgi:hypothetical protein